MATEFGLEAQSYVIPSEYLNDLVTDLMKGIDWETKTRSFPGRAHLEGQVFYRTEKYGGHFLKKDEIPELSNGFKEGQSLEICLDGWRGRKILVGLETVATIEKSHGSHGNLIARTRDYSQLYLNPKFIFKAFQKYGKKNQ